jgi:hypothetical protein
MDNVTDKLFHLPIWYWYLQDEKDIREINNRHQAEYFINVFYGLCINNFVS